MEIMSIATTYTSRIEKENMKKEMTRTENGWIMSIEEKMRQK